MKKSKPKKRPGILIRFYPGDIARINRLAADQSTPRENWMRRVVLAAVAAHEGDPTVAKFIFSDTVVPRRPTKGAR